MSNKKRRPSVFVPRMVFGTVAAGVLPILAAEACSSDSDSPPIVALAVAAFDASDDVAMPPVVALAVISFDAATDAPHDASDDAADASDDGPDGSS